MRDPYAYSPGLEALVVPLFHSLTKSEGEVVVASWSARNTSQTTRFFYLELIVGFLLIRSSVVATVAPGATVQNNAALDLTLAGGQTWPGTLRMVESDSAGNPLGVVSEHTFSVAINAPPPLFLTVLQQSFTVIALNTTDWQGDIRNTSPSQTGFFVAARTETTNLFGPFTRRTTLAAVLPAQTRHWSTVGNWSDTITFIQGELWVEEVDSAGAFIRNLTIPMPYVVFL